MKKRSILVSNSTKIYWTGPILSLKLLMIDIKEVYIITQIYKIIRSACYKFDEKGIVLVRWKLYNFILISPIQKQHMSHIYMYFAITKIQISHQI